MIVLEKVPLKELELTQARERFHAIRFKIMVHNEAESSSSCPVGKLSEKVFSPRTG